MPSTPSSSAAEQSGAAVSALRQIRDWLPRQHPALRQAVQVTAAVGLSYLLARLFDLAQGTWAVITAVIVVQASVGGSVKAATDRFAGTFAGALWGAAVALTVPHENPTLRGVAILVAVAPLALLVAARPNFRVAPITAMIVLLPQTGSTVSPAVYALDRVLEISLGNLVGVGIALLILPARAHNILMAAGGRIIRANAELLTALVAGMKPGSERPVVQPIHTRIRAGLKAMEASADEANRERRVHLTGDPDPAPLIATLYRVRHDFVMIGRSASKPLPDAVAGELGPCLDQLRDATTPLLEGMAHALESAGRAPGTEAFETALKAYGARMEAVWKGDALRQLSGEDAARIFSLRFAFEQLGLDLRDLGTRVDEQIGVSTEEA